MQSNCYIIIIVIIIITCPTHMSRYVSWRPITHTSTYE